MFGKRARRLTLGSLWIALGWGIACGATDRQVDVATGGNAGSSQGGAINGSRGGAHSGGALGEAGASGGGAGGAGGAGAGAPSLGGTGSGGEAGSSSGGTVAGGTGGEAGSGPVHEDCEPFCSGDTPICEAGRCVQCTADAPPRRCAGNRPERCVDGAWVPQPVCGGTTPACSNGICAGVRARATLSTVGIRTTSGSVRLVSHGLGGIARTCGPIANKTVCVSDAAIRP